MAGAVSFFHSAARDGFGAGVIAAYEQGRPEHPVEGIEFVLRTIGVPDASSSASPASSSPSSHSPSALPILEIGCGTGKYSRPLFAALERRRKALGSDGGLVPSLVCTDPADMSARLQETLPTVPFHKVTADALAAVCPAEGEGFFSSVIGAQMFHWCANAPTVREIHRVLARGGYLALVWNMRSARGGSPSLAPAPAAEAAAGSVSEESAPHPWLTKLETILDEYYEPSTPRQVTGEWRRCLEDAAKEGLFSPLESRFLSVHPGGGYVGTEEQVVQYMMSISDISKRPESEKPAIEARFRALLNDPSTPTSTNAKGERVWSIPMTVEIHWCRKL